MKSTQSVPHWMTPWLIWGLAVSAYFTEFIIRVAPSSIVPYLMEAFQASSLQVSSFSAYFLYAYVGMQIPAGILIDRYSLKLCLSVTTVFCALNTGLFCLTSSLIYAQGARLGLGLGAAFAWLGTIKIAFLWLSPRQFSLSVGATQALGMMGAALGSSLIGRLSQVYGWRASLQHLSALLFFIGVAMIFFIRLPTPSHTKTSSKRPSLRRQMGLVFKNRQTWLVATLGGLLYTPTAVFAELWGSVYLTHTQNILPAKAQDGVSLIFIGWAVGGVWASSLANQWGRRPLLIASAFLSLLFMGVILYAPPLPLLLLYVLLFLYGVSNAGMSAAYTLVAELTPKSASGIALGFANSMSVVIGALCQQGVGLWLDRSHTHTALDLKRSMIWVVMAASLALLMSFFVKETLNAKAKLP